MLPAAMSAPILFPPNDTLIDVLDGWTLTGMGVLRSLVLLLATGGTHIYVEATLMRRSPPWPWRGSAGWRTSPMHVGAAVSNDAPTVAVYLKPSRWPGPARRP